MGKRKTEEEGSEDGAEEITLEALAERLEGDVSTQDAIGVLRNLLLWLKANR
jgi:hypothetical protein